MKYISIKGSEGERHGYRSQRGQPNTQEGRPKIKKKRESSNDDTDD